MFRKTSHSRVFQDLVDQIQQAIVDGRLKPGDRLPSQRDLMAQFATSRASIREALRVLEQKGLIEVKLGVSGGAIVKDVNTRLLNEGLFLLIQHQRISFDHLAEFREGVEGNVAALAARRATPLDTQRLQRLLDKARSHLAEGPSRWPDFIQVDVQVHIALAEIARNPVYVAVLQMVHENLLGAFEHVAVKEEKVLKETYRNLCALVEAVCQGRVEKARALAKAHVRHFTRRLNKAQPPPSF